MPSSKRAAIGVASQRRRYHGGNDDHIFISVRNRVLHYQTVRDPFQALMGEMGLQYDPARQGSRPRIHDLRHNWAVRALQACPPGSDSVREHALAVSTYLGHAKPSSTFVYLHTTAQLLADIADRSERFARGELSDLSRHSYQCLSARTSAAGAPGQRTHLRYYALRLFFEFGAQKLKIRPSALTLEQLDTPLVLEFLAHLETALVPRDLIGKLLFPEEAQKLRLIAPGQVESMPQAVEPTPAGVNGGSLH